MITIKEGRHILESSLKHGALRDVATEASSVYASGVS